jgi:hypothetical protein
VIAGWLKHITQLMDSACTSENGSGNSLDDFIYHALAEYKMKINQD